MARKILLPASNGDALKYFLLDVRVLRAVTSQIFLHNREF
jgi:hypothetical protein